MTSRLVAWVEARHARRARAMWANPPGICPTKPLKGPRSDAQAETVPVGPDAQNGPQGRTERFTPCRPDCGHQDGPGKP